jgi:hypothetical protein
VVQVSGGYVSSFGLPGSASYASSKLVCGASTLPTGTGGNPIALAYNGQVIDTVRAPSTRVRALSQQSWAACLCKCAHAALPRLATRARSPPASPSLT